MSNDHSSGASGNRQAEGASAEDTLRALDQRGAQAALALDVATLDALYSPDSLLHGPDSVVRPKHEVLAAVRNSRFRYSAFSRTTEYVAIHGGIAVTIGRETVVPQGIHVNAGKTVQRRFTHIWRNEGRRWRLLVRHANVVPPQ